MDEVYVKGAREHNLRSVDLRFPRDSLVCFTGLSGSGKSSLAYDTIYREGQRRFLESLSSYARQFMGSIEKPKLDHIEGLSPTVAIDQKSVSRNPRSTVGTITELLDFYRLLMSRLGTPHCPVCGLEVSAQAPEQIVDTILQEGNEGDAVLVLAPVVRGRKGSYRKELATWRAEGHVRARIDGQVLRLDEEIQLARYKKHEIELVVDRLRLSEERRERLLDSVEQALSHASGFVTILRTPDGGTPAESMYSALRACPEGHGALPEIEPVLFSFNSPQGACPTCDGLGESRGFSEALLVKEPDASLLEGALACINAKGQVHWSGYRLEHLAEICRDHGGDPEQAFRRMPKRAREVLFHGSEDRIYEFDFEHRIDGRVIKGKDRKCFPGIIPYFERMWGEFRPRSLQRFQTVVECPDCHGARIGEVPRAVRFRDHNIAELASMTIADSSAFFETEWKRIEKKGGREASIGRELFRELLDRLSFLQKVGLGYLALDRAAGTLSGGESQRIRLAAQVGSGLRGVLYVLDEPSIGLHARDNQRLIETLHELRDRGNTVCVVEHDEETMMASDFLVDVGPGAGVEGGHIVAAGLPEEVIATEASLTGRYLRGDLSIEIPERRGPGKDFLVLEGARQHNLKNVTARFPLGRFVCVSGVSGSGKSSLVHHILHKALARELNGAEVVPGAHRRIRGMDQLEKVIEIDQSPIGRTPRSNPATYTGVWTLIRDLYASLPESRARGYPKGRFSFNVKGGRCDACDGAGVKQLEMQFLEAVEVPCEVCEGRRFNRETLEVLFKGKTISEILDMTIAEALEFFANHPKIKHILDVLASVGLSYLTLGQRSTTLSGGEAQRIKLGSELARPTQGKTFYILDEPTTGLHFEDVRKLLAALQELVDGGNTVLVIEHNLDVLKCADWILDLGPDGGDGGGRLVAEGSPEELVLCKESYTGAALKPLLGRRRKRSKKTRRARPKKRSKDLIVKGARQHNLQGISTRFPASSFSVVTGLSGSGKTSLAFDTVFREGQRRFIESLSTYARRFLGRMERAPVDSLEGLLPAIAIDQKSAGRNPRSTVGTTTEILDYLRLLFARVGLPHCPIHHEPLVVNSPSMLAARLLQERQGQKGLILAPIEVPAGLLEEDLVSWFQEAEREWKEEAFVRFALQDKRGSLEVLRVGDEFDRERLRKGLWLVVDRVSFSKRSQSRVAEALELASQWGKGKVAAAEPDGKPEAWSMERSCTRCGFHLPIDLHPRFFSFNHYGGACPDCQGLGVRNRLSIERLITHPEKPLFGGAMTGAHMAGLGFLLHPRRSFARVAYAMAKAHRFDLEKRAFKSLTDRQRGLVLEGTGERLYEIHLKRERASGTREMVVQEAWQGLIPALEERYASREHTRSHVHLSRLMEEDDCRTCRGSRLSPGALGVKLGGQDIAALCRMTVGVLRPFLASLDLDKEAKTIAREILREIDARLGFLEDMGLDYLEIDRKASSLSGGEAQRIRLAGQLGSRLTGTLYVLDEPTVGLHPRDTERLLENLTGLRDLGNTVIAVEHDEHVVRRADWVVDLGPGAGRKGGEVVYEGPPEGLLRAKGSLTADWLSGRRARPIHEKRRSGTRQLQLRKVRTHNLKGIDASFPLSVLSVVTGVSGSGKSSLVMESLLPALRGETGPYQVMGGDAISQVIVVDQEAIGSSPQSCPATYAGIFTPIRELFAKTEQSRRLGYAARRFSFNASDGRCPACEGRGQLCIEMHFLADVWVRCDLCRGKRYNEGTLAVTWRGKTIADVLDMEIAEAAQFFSAHRKIRSVLSILEDVGLGYMKLGQGVHTLSGGEAQRLKLAAELCKRPKPGQLFLLDEPTTGLHMEDVSSLLKVLQRLVDRSATVIVIEHNLDVLRDADWVVDLGPEGGDRGGELLYAGAPEGLRGVRRSHTARFLEV